MHVYLSIYQSISLDLSIYLNNYSSIHKRIYLSVYLSFLSIYLFIFPSIIFNPLPFTGPNSQVSPFVGINFSNPPTPQASKIAETPKFLMDRSRVILVYYICFRKHISIQLGKAA